MTPETREHAPRVRFDTLFSDPRHYRGDCRLLRTAVRRGWLDDAPQAVRDALVARFENTFRERQDSDDTSVRVLLAGVQAALELVQADHRPALRLLRYSWGGDPTNRATGRPRERWHVSDFANRIDANALRRSMLADGIDPATVPAVVVTRTNTPDEPGERIALAVAPDARYGRRVWLVCPRCSRRRVHLYGTRAGVRCRGCARIGYRR